jgi:hypothetical protein
MEAEAPDWTDEEFVAPPAFIALRVIGNVFQQQTNWFPDNLALTHLALIVQYRAFRGGV